MLGIVAVGVVRGSRKFRAHIYLCDSIAFLFGQLAAAVSTLSAQRPPDCRGTGLYSRGTCPGWPHLGAATVTRSHRSLINAVVLKDDNGANANCALWIIKDMRRQILVLN